MSSLASEPIMQNESRTYARNGISVIELSHPMRDRRGRRLLAKSLRKSVEQYLDTGEPITLGNGPIEVYVCPRG